MPYKAPQQHMRHKIIAQKLNRGTHDQTCVIIFGSMKSGKRRTANKESDVNAFAGVRSPPSKEKSPNETTITTTGILFKIKLLHCKTRRKILKVIIKQKEEIHRGSLNRKNITRS